MIALNFGYDARCGGFAKWFKGNVVVLDRAQEGEALKIYLSELVIGWSPVLLLMSFELAKTLLEILLSRLGRYNVASILISDLHN